MGYENGFRAPENAVTQRLEDPEYFMIGPNATPAAMLPGIVVTGDGSGAVKEAGATGVFYGTLGYEAVQPGDYKPKNRDSAFPIGSRVPVHVGPGIRIRGRLAASQTIIKGDLLKVAAGGLLEKADDEDRFYAIADEPATSAAAGSPIWAITVR